MEPDVADSRRETDRLPPTHASTTSHRRPAALGTRLRAWRWAMRARLSEHSAYLALARARHGSGVASEATDLVIDGFPRCGNTFAVVAFQLAQPSPRRVSHHIHSAANIIAAAKRGTPIMVTTRDPEDAVLSCLIREPYVSIRQALSAYIALYERLQPWHDRLLVADFGEITTNMAAVIDRINAKYDTTFTPFTHTPDRVAECFAIIEDRARRPPWGDHIGHFLSGTATLAQLHQAANTATNRHQLPIAEHRVGRPSPHRTHLKRELRTAYAAPRLAQLRAKAEHAHRTFTTANSNSPPRQA